ncbi:MAG: glycogen/starch synthase [Candidatus Paceibacterota bacterium]|jgi:glycogen(starch) synthase
MTIQKKQIKADMLFEMSWEVCNKVGGIFTVLSSKARHMKEYYDDNYFLVGPYIAESTRSSFKEESVPEIYKDSYNQLKEKGIIIHFGTWLVESEPQVILVDYRNYWSAVNEIKKDIWDNYGLDSLNSPYDFNEPVLWSWAVGILMENIMKVHSKKTIVLHAHEWLSGGAILYLKKNKINVATVFTTHATTLGRTIAGHGGDLYSILDKINPRDESYKYGVNAKHDLEKITAHAADVFSTVSQITALESKYILEKDADVLLPNGLDMSKFHSFEELTLKHNAYRTKLREFVLYYFYPYYNIDLKNSLFFFTASRYEFHNKGLDIFIESLGRLNDKLKKDKSKKTVITFFWIPASINSIRQDLIEARESFQDLKDLLEENQEEIKENLLYTLSSQKEINEKNIIGSDSSLELKRKIMQLRSKSGRAPVSTHELIDPDNDPIMKAFKQAGLLNSEEDRVKVIFYPIYLSGADGLSDLDYYQSIQACHLGVFPSYYEPWGYTPLETAALGVGSLTSNLSGFGRYFYEKLHDIELPGIYILDIEKTKREEMMNTFVDILYNYTNLDKRGRIDNKIQARKVAFMADWKIFAENYIDAHNMAVSKINK